VDATTFDQNEIDLSTIDTRNILQAKQIIVGEIADISFVFKDPNFPNCPLSLVMIRIERDIKQEAERDNPPDKRPERDRTLTFAGVGGPNPDGIITEVAGFPVFEPGERVFLCLVPTIHPIEHAGQKVNVTSPSVGGRYPIKRGKNPDEDIIQRSWKGLDVTVSQMIRIVRTTLKQPEQMRALERRIYELGRAQMPKAARLDILLREVGAIEANMEK